VPYGRTVLCQSASPFRYRLRHLAASAHPFPEPATHAPRPVARDPKRQREIILAHDLPALVPSGLDRRLFRDIPTVVLEAPDQAIAGTLQETVPCEISDVIFEQDQPRPPTREVEAAEHFELVTFDVDRQEIKADGRRRLGQDIVERA